jgi:hypothetical protein
MGRKRTDMAENKAAEKLKAIEEIDAEDQKKLAEAARRLNDGDESAFNDIYGLTVEKFTQSAEAEFPDDSVYQDVLQMTYVKIADSLQGRKSDVSENPEDEDEMQPDGPEKEAADKLAELTQDVSLDYSDPDAVLNWMDAVFSGVIDLVHAQKNREVPEDLNEFLKIGKSIISTKDIKDFEKKKKAEEEKKEEEEIMNLH